MAGLRIWQGRLPAKRTTCSLHETLPWRPISGLPQSTSISTSQHMPVGKSFLLPAQLLNKDLRTQG